MAYWVGNCKMAWRLIKKLVTNNVFVKKELHAYTLFPLVNTKHFKVKMKCEILQDTPPQMELSFLRIQ